MPLREKLFGQDSLAIDTRNAEAGGSGEGRGLGTRGVETAEGLGPAEGSSLESLVSTAEVYVAGGWGESNTHNSPLPHSGDRNHTPSTA